MANTSLLREFYGHSDTFNASDFKWNDLELALLDLGYPSTLFPSLRCQWPGSVVVESLLSFGHHAASRDRTMKHLLVKLRIERDDAQRRVQGLKNELRSLRSSIEQKHPSHLERELEELRDELNIERAAIEQVTKEKDELGRQMEMVQDDHASQLVQIEADRKNQLANIAAEFKRLDQDHKSKLADEQGKLAEMQRRESEMKERLVKDRKTFTEWKKIHETDKVRVERLRKENKLLLEEKEMQRRRATELKHQQSQTESADVCSNLREGDVNVVVVDDDEMRQVDELAKKRKIDEDNPSESALTTNFIGKLSMLEKSLSDHLHVLAEPFHIQMERSFLRSFIRSILDIKEDLAPSDEGEVSTVEHHHPLAASSTLYSPSESSVSSNTTPPNMMSTQLPSTFVKEAQHFDPRLPQQPSSFRDHISRPRFSDGIPRRANQAFQPGLPNQPGGGYYRNRMYGNNRKRGYHSNASARRVTRDSMSPVG